MSGQHRGRRGTSPDLAAMRESYSLAGLAEGDLAADWVTQFQHLAGRRRRRRPARTQRHGGGHRVTDGIVASRTVLCKGVDEAGIVFYTNLNSDKSRDLQANPRAAATFPWIGLQRQVHVPWPGGPGRRRDGAGSTGPAGRAAPGSVPGPARSPACCRTGPLWRRCRPRRRTGSAKPDEAPDPAAAVLGRLADPARDRRVLAGQVRPAARPAAVPGRSDPASWVVERLAP